MRDEVDGRRLPNARARRLARAVLQPIGATTFSKRRSIQ
jgi:hypothetical protein